ncbi:bifunctional adenosylcobinamide kinase/adenosylcobinamide-phosphate guanylyltransferase [Vogesella fluminis]|uniref:Bifunctional adenosylcobalamin biosynthesis protein n=1 Tax=Vogesella fluminis TaxID=1069161 RepID=A0ABQ3HE15_9NEIS|nr:bifunctional adenosylcobinamide kinase/adenosylcobinamide-phosphate guanylyltransferase [Vogesella fluminis]GHD78853.1 adenosylcobinamide kinase/adenosylcobinamide phosphate guanyltransferase [Vogesella fluminis]
MSTHLITGGARSGKSRYAERLALAHRGPVLYIATAERRDDDSFAARIAHHRERRPANWGLVEAGPELAAPIAAQGTAGSLLLIDCLGMWLMRFFDADGRFRAGDWQRERAALLAAVAATPAAVLLVSNEIGWGVVPLGAETRHFVDELGRLNQDVAALCRRVTLVACGQPLVLKAPA